MIELVLIHCLTNVCIEERVRPLFPSVTACLAGSQIVAALWLGSHPGIFMVGIKCRPASKET